jgi:hypothetical protein
MIVCGKYVRIVKITILMIEAGGTMEKSLSEQQGSSLTVYSPEVMQNISSILALFGAKSDSMCRIFNKQIVVGLKELSILNTNINEKLSIHSVEYVTTDVDITFANKKTISFKTWVEFVNYDYESINSRVEQIYIQWDFKVKLNYEVSQKHTIYLRITSSPKPSDLIKALINGGLDEDNEFEVKTSVMLCKVDFINNVLAEELMNVVEKWNDLCESAIAKVGKISCFAHIHSVFFANVLELLVATSIVLIIAIILKLMIAYRHIYISIPIMILSMIPLYMLIKRICHSAGKKLYERLDDIMSTHVFNLTTGDRKVNEINKEKNSCKKQAGGFILNIAITVVLGVIFYLLP